MAKDTQGDRIPAPLGSIEPHALMLTVPQEEQLLYKMMTVQDLLRSVAGSYLHFNRVDSYSDFDGADLHDGEQLPRDQHGNTQTTFEKAPDFSAADYYDRSRARAYACCFSLENSNFIWANYANGSEKGKNCVVFHFGKLRAALNRTLESEDTAVEYNGVRCRQIFSVNYGTVDYVNWNEHQVNAPYLPNPVSYTYLKDMQFAPEKEMRVSLSVIGMGQFVLNDGTTIEFPPSLQVPFNFRTAIADGTIREILRAPDCDPDFLGAELHKLGITPS